MKQLLVPILIASGMVLASCGGNAVSKEPNPVEPDPVDPDPIDPDPVDPKPSDPLDSLPETVELWSEFVDDTLTATPKAVHENNGVYAVEGTNFSWGDFFAYGVFYDGGKFYDPGVVMEALDVEDKDLYLNSRVDPYSDMWLNSPNASSPPDVDLTFEGVYSEAVFADNSVRADDATIRVDADTEVMTVEGPSALEGVNLEWEWEYDTGYQYYEGEYDDADSLHAFGSVDRAGSTGFVTYYNQDVSGYVLGVR